MRLTHFTTEQIHQGSALEAHTLLVDGLDQLGLTLNEQCQLALLKHIELLAHWNRRLNLTSITTDSEMVINHLLDSLSVSPLIAGDRVLDIGTGGGFPGLPLAFVFTDKQFTLLDSRGKRIEFLRHVAGVTGAGNVSLAKSRVEDYRPAEKFDTLVTRAFASLADMLKLTRKLQHPGTRLVAMKGRMPAHEIAALTEAQRKVMQVQTLQIPYSRAERHAITFQF